MASPNATEPKKVEAGQKIKLMNGPIHASASSLVEYEVMPSCGESNGHWACAAHPEECPHMEFSFNHASFTDGAAEGGCIGVWICHEHGPEQP